MKLSKIKDKIINFYDLETEEEKSKVLEEIKDISNSVEKEVFVDEIRELFEQKQLSGIGIIYEALGQNPEKWGSFFFEEIQRAFRNAEDSNEPSKILDSLEEISMTDESKIIQRNEIINYLETKMNHANDVLKYKSIWYLGDWIDKSNISEHSNVVNKIKANLKDQNWRIRMVSKRFLEELDRLPNDYKMKLSDKLKVKFLNEFKM